MTDGTSLPPPAKRPGTALTEAVGDRVALASAATPQPHAGANANLLSGPAAQHTAIPAPQAAATSTSAGHTAGNSQHSAPTHATPHTVRPPSKYGVITGAVRAALYTIPALVAFAVSDPAKERVRTDPTVDQKTGLSQDYADKLKSQYGNRSPAQMKAELDAAVARAADAKNKRAATGTPTTEAPDPTQQAMAAGNRGFALANQPTGQAPASRALLNGLMTTVALGFASLLMRRRSGGSWTGAFSNQAQGLTGAIYGLDDAERAHRGQMRVEHKAGPGGLGHAARVLDSATKAKWNHNAAIADGQSVPPRVLPEVQSLMGGSRVKVADSPADLSYTEQLAKKQLHPNGEFEAKPDTTKFEKNPGRYPAPGSTP